MFSSTPMQSKIHFFVVFSLLFCCSNAFNITRLLDQYPDFSTFNNYLSETQLASTINSRQTITVLVVSNDAISPLSGKPPNVLKKILSVHVVLDYYDVKKLQNLPNKTQSLVTLFQSSGEARGEQGFLNATDLSTGSVVFGSAAKGATLGANLVKSIAAQPYNISVLQISTIIIPMGIENSTNPSNNSTSPSNNSTSPPPSPPPPPPPKNSSSNSTSPSIAPTPAKNSTSPTKAPTPPPARAPRKALSPAPTPSNANAPGSSPPMPADAPGSSPKPSDAPAADEPAASEGTTPRVGLGVAITTVLLTVFSIGHMI